MRGRWPSSRHEFRIDDAKNMLMYTCRTLILCFFLIFIAPGCSGPKLLHSEAATGADLTAYKTFDFYSVEASGDQADINASGAISKLEDAIALQMQKYGYLMTKTDPDLLINIGIVVNEKVQTRKTDFRTDAPQYIGQR